MPLILPLLMHGYSAAGGISVIGSGLQMISTSSSADSYSSGATTYTVPSGSDRLVVIYVSYLRDAGDPTMTATLGAQSATEHYTTIGANYAPGVTLFYIKEADIPAGANALTVNSGTPLLRSMAASIRTYGGVNQTTPLGTTQTFDAVSSSVIADDVTVGGATSWVVSQMAGTTSGTTQLPITVSNGTLVDSGETGLAGTSDNSWAFTEDAVLATGLREHSYTLASGAARLIVAITEMQAA